jgi:TPP-dependent pyruvate/acetoin dehydrogenase alpha subunit
MISQKLATEEDLKKVTKECNKEVDAQLEKAKTLPDPPLEELYSDVLLQPEVYDYHVKTCQGTKYFDIPHGHKAKN